MKMIDKKDIILSFKKSYSITYDKDYFCCVGGSANIYSIKTGKMVANFKNMKQPSFSRFTSDNRLIVKTTKGLYYIYDLISQSLVKKLYPPKGVIGLNTDFLVTVDNKFIIDFAYVFPVCRLMIMEIETGEYSLYDLNSARTGKVLYNESESVYYVIISKNGKVNDVTANSVMFYSFAYPYCKLELKKMAINNYKTFSQIDYNLGKFAVNEYKNKIGIFDIASGIEEQLYYDKGGVLYDLKWSKNGKYIVLVESKTIRIFDTITKDCVKSYDVNYGCFAEFYDNDTKLLIGTWEKGYCIDISSLQN